MSSPPDLRRERGGPIRVFGEIAVVLCHGAPVQLGFFRGRGGQVDEAEYW